jgi:hypothetical protein
LHCDEAFEGCFWLAFWQRSRDGNRLALSANSVIRFLKQKLPQNRSLRYGDFAMTNAIDSPGATIGPNAVLAGAPRSSYINIAAFINKERPL